MDWGEDAQLKNRGEPAEALNLHTTKNVTTTKRETQLLGFTLIYKE